MKKTLSLLVVLLLLFSFSGCSSDTKLDPNNPVTLTMWHVYGSQTESPLNDAIDEFNRTKGTEMGIVINVESVTDSTSIDEALLAAANNSPGAVSLPDLFTAYPRVVEQIGTDKLLDWSTYFDEEELDCYVDDFLAEGYFGDQLLMLPIAKSSELFFLNQTLYDRFSADTGMTTAELSTFEGIFTACDRYYDWSDGQAMFQINDFYHYFLVNIDAIGGEFIKDGKIDKLSSEFQTVYKPMARAAIYGGLCVGDGYASDRWKTGEIICNIGSTAGILYLRDYVTYTDNTTEDIQLSTFPYPVFQSASPTVIHRGGGLFAVKSEDERKNEAAAVFAKWITQSESNLEFVTQSGYLPVTDEVYQTLFSDMSIVENEKYRMLYETVSNMDEYTFCALPRYEGAGETQSDFEKDIKAALSAAHEDYISRTQAGEDAGIVMEELLASSLAEIQNS